MPTYKTQIEAKEGHTLDPDNWVEITAENQEAAAIEALRASGQAAKLLPCTVSVSDPLHHKLMFHDNGMPSMVHSFDLVRTN